MHLSHLVETTTTGSTINQDVGTLLVSIQATGPSTPRWHRSSTTGIAVNPVQTSQTTLAHHRLSNAQCFVNPHVTSRVVRRHVPRDAVSSRGLQVIQRPCSRQPGFPSRTPQISLSVHVLPEAVWQPVLNSPSHLLTQLGVPRLHRPEVPSPSI
jgi:hypothetical protein